MNFLHCFSILITFFTGILWAAVSEGNIDDMEVAHLASNLSPIECLRLLEDIYLKRPLSDEEFSRPETRTSLNDESIARQQLLAMPFFNRDNCRDKLQEWTRNLPQGSNKWARMALEAELRSLRRPELAKYVRKNRRLVRYFNEITRMSRNTAKHATQDPKVVSKNNHVATSNGVFKGALKESAIQFYPKLGEAKPARDHGNVATSREIGSAHITSEKTNTNADTTTKWTAFLTLLGVIILTILATVIFALYKRNRGGNKLRVTEDKCTSDRCPLADRYGRGQPSCCDFDPERTRATTGSLRRGGRRRDSSPPPSTTVCVRHEEIAGKSKSQKYLEVETRAPEKSGKRGCSKKCSGLKQHENEAKERPVRSDKSTRTKQRKNTDKCSQAVDQPARALKKLHEKIFGILRRENPPTCKCCKCSVVLEDSKPNGTKCLPRKTRNIVCEDQTCPKTRLKDIAELCLSPDETSPTDELKDTEKSQKRPQRKKKKKRKRTRKDKNGDADKEKESERSSPGNSARSKDKDKGSRVRKKPTKARKERYNVVEACTRKTCGLERTNYEETSNF